MATKPSRSSMTLRKREPKPSPQPVISKTPRKTNKKPPEPEGPYDVDGRIKDSYRLRGEPYDDDEVEPGQPHNVNWWKLHESGMARPEHQPSFRAFHDAVDENGTVQVAYIRMSKYRFQAQFGGDYQKAAHFVRSHLIENVGDFVRDARNVLARTLKIKTDKLELQRAKFSRILSAFIDTSASSDEYGQLVDPISPEYELIPGGPRASELDESEEEEEEGEEKEKEDEDVEMCLNIAWRPKWKQPSSFLKQYVLEKSGLSISDFEYDCSTTTTSDYWISLDTDDVDMVEPTPPASAKTSVTSQSSLSQDANLEDSDAEGEDSDYTEEDCLESEEVPIPKRSLRHQSLRGRASRTTRLKEGKNDTDSGPNKDLAPRRSVPSRSILRGTPSTIKRLKGRRVLFSKFILNDDEDADDVLHTPRSINSGARETHLSATSRSVPVRQSLRSKFSSQQIFYPDFLPPAVEVIQSKRPGNITQLADWLDGKSVLEVWKLTQVDFNQFKEALLVIKKGLEQVGGNFHVFEPENHLLMKTQVSSKGLSEEAINQYTEDEDNDEDDPTADDGLYLASNRPVRGKQNQKSLPRRRKQTRGVNQDVDEDSSFGSEYYTNSENEDFGELLSDDDDQIECPRKRGKIIPEGSYSNDTDCEGSMNEHNDDPADSDSDASSKQRYYTNYSRKATQIGGDIHKPENEIDVAKDHQEGKDENEDKNENEEMTNRRVFGGKTLEIKDNTDKLDTEAIAASNDHEKGDEFVEEPSLPVATSPASLPLDGINSRGDLRTKEAKVLVETYSGWLKVRLLDEIKRRKANGANLKLKGGRNNQTLINALQEHDRQVAAMAEETGTEDDGVSIVPKVARGKHERNTSTPDTLRKRNKKVDPNKTDGDGEDEVSVTPEVAGGNHKITTSTPINSSTKLAKTRKLNEDRVDNVLKVPEVSNQNRKRSTPASAPYKRAKQIQEQADTRDNDSDAPVAHDVPREKNKRAALDVRPRNGTTATEPKDNQVAETDHNIGRTPQKNDKKYRNQTATSDGADTEDNDHGIPVLSKVLGEKRKRTTHTDTPRKRTKATNPNSDEAVEENYDAGSENVGEEGQEDENKIVSQ